LFQNNCLEPIGIPHDGINTDQYVSIDLGSCGTQTAFFDLPDYFQQTLFALSIIPIIITYGMEKKKKSYE
jgi:hypothetical protein